MYTRGITLKISAEQTKNSRFNRSNGNEEETTNGLYSRFITLSIESRSFLFYAPSPHAAGLDQIQHEFRIFNEYYYYHRLLQITAVCTIFA